MSVHHKAVETGDADLESTAELPVLDVAAFEATMTEQQLTSTDTWIIPSSAMPAALAHAAVSAAAEEQRSKLEIDLSALSVTLREVEERLTRKDERLTQMEEELAEARAARTAAEERASELTAELVAARAGLVVVEEQLAKLQRAAQAQAEELRRTTESRDAATRALALGEANALGLESRLAGYLELLQSFETQRGVFASEAIELADKLQMREADLARFERELHQQSGRAEELASDLAARELRVGTLEREVNALSAALAQRNEQLENSERAQLKLHESVATLTESLASRSERLIALESATARQTESFTERQREIDRLVAAESRVTALERDLTDQKERLRAAQEELRLSTLRVRELEDERSVAEVAQSGALLGNIQQSNKRMELSESTENYELAPEGAVRLLIRADGDSEVVHVLSRKTTIGRTGENDLQIDTKFISRNHAVILAGPSYTIIEDLNSTNGVLVNNRRVTRHTLKDGDSVVIGRTQFRFAVRPNRAA